MAKVARALSAVQSAAESQQQLIPALQQLLATCSIASRTANAAECDATTTTSSAPCHPPTSSSSLGDAASAASSSRPYQHQAAFGLQQYQDRQWLNVLSSHGTPGSAVCVSASDGSEGSQGSGTSGGPRQPSSTTSTTSSSSSSDSGAKAQADPLTLALQVLQANSNTHQLTPSAIVQQLDKHIVGQPDAKRAVAVALRNRWRRHMLPADLAEEITPKNILMIGPTGCGKTEIARRLAQLVSSPFIKVEATKFTELGFVGRDVDEIVKDLMEAALSLTRTRLGEALREVAERAAEDVILAALTGAETEDMKGRFRDLYRAGHLEDSRVELDLDALGLSEQGGGGGMGTHGNPLQAFAAMMEAMAGRAGGRGGAGGRQQGKASMTVAEARKLLTDGEIERSLQSERVVAEALRAAQQDGIVFIDEIDKIVETTRGVSGATSSNVSSEGVQRDLLPILEGSVVPTKYGNVSTDHVLFIASGAFHSSKPSDMLAELQGRLPVRVELKGLTADDFYRILTEPKHNMIKQQQVLLATEGIDLVFTDGAVRAIAEAAHQANLLLDNIGARRLHTVVERVLADISFSAPEKVAAAAQQQQEQQQQQEASQQAAGSTAGPSSSSIKGSAAGSSSRGARSKAAGGSSQGGKSRGKGAGSKDAAGKGLLRHEVTEDMVQACMKEVLKQKDLSRYML